MRELARRQVDRERHHVQPFAAPQLVLRARGADHPLAHRHDHAALFEDRDEFVRAHQFTAPAAPAQQHFERVHAARGGAHDRLVVQLEFTPRQRAAQARFEVEVARRRLVHALGEKLVIVAARRLGLVHRRVRVAHQGIDVAAVLRIQADADRRRDVQAAAFDGARRGQRRDDRVADRGGSGTLLDPGQQHDEFIAPEARHQVARAHRAHQPARDFAQQLVAHQVAKRIVDRLEPVQVEEDQRQARALVRFVAAGHAAHRRIEPVRQHGAVGQAGQAVVVGHVVHARLGLAPLVDFFLQQRIGAGQFGRAFGHAHFELVACTPHGVGRFTLGRHVVHQPDAAPARECGVEQAPGQARPEARAVAAYHFMLGHVGLACGELRLGYGARRQPAALVRIQFAYRCAVHAAGRRAEQLFHLAVAVQRAAVLDDGDAQHRIIQDRAVFHQRLAQRLLVALFAGAVFEHPDRALVRVERIDLVADHQDPGRRAVLAHEDAFGAKRPAIGQLRIGIGAQRAVRLFVRIQHARGHADRLVGGIAEHRAEGRIGAPDHAVAGEHDADRCVGHDRLHFTGRLARLGHILDDPDRARAAVARFDRAAAQARPEGRAIAAPKLLLALFEHVAPPQHGECFGGQGLIRLGRHAHVRQRNGIDFMLRIAEHFAQAWVE